MERRTVTEGVDDLGRIILDLNAENRTLRERVRALEAEKEEREAYENEFREQVEAALSRIEKRLNAFDAARRGEK